MKLNLKSTSAALLLSLSVASSNAASAIRSIDYVPLSSVKMEQVSGETDNQLNGALTRNQTLSNDGLNGTDEGYYVEHDGKGWFFFGDTIELGGDAVGYTTATDPETEGLPLDFLADASGNYFKVVPPTTTTGGFEHVVGALSVNGNLYFIWRGGFEENESHPDYRTGMHRLYRFDPDTKTSTLITFWAGRYDPLGTCAFSVEDGNELGIYNGDVVVIWGSKGPYRESDMYFAWVPAADFENEVQTNGIRYFTGVNPSGGPNFSANKNQARPIIFDPVIGDFSVQRIDELDIYMMTYDSRPVDGDNRRGIVMRWAPQPWGPWSDAKVIYERSREDGLGEFIHQGGVNDGLQGPVIGITPPEYNGDRAAFELDRWGGMYGPQIISRFTDVDLAAQTITLYWIGSTWNPYQVVLMKSQLEFELYGTETTQAEVIEASWTRNNIGWDPIEITGDFIDPIVVASPVSFAGIEPGHVRIRNVSPEGFEYTLEEWDYLPNQSHAADETIYFLVMERGTHDIGGKLWQATSKMVGDIPATIPLDNAFNQNFATFAQVVSVNGPASVIPRTSELNTASFKVQLQEEEANDGIHAAEIIHLIAAEKGAAYSIPGGIFTQVGDTGPAVTEAAYTVSYGPSATENPPFFAQISSLNDPDPAGLRFTTQSSSGTEIFIEEEKSADAETARDQAETVSWMIIDTLAIETLNLTSMCSADPATERRWRVRNPNPFDVPYDWEVYGTSQSGSLIAPPGDSYFFTQTVGGANTTKIYWVNENAETKSKTKASSGAACP